MTMSIGELSTQIGRQNFLRVGSLSSPANDIEAVALQISGKLRQYEFSCPVWPMLRVYPQVEVCVGPPSVVFLDDLGNFRS